ncbi:MAG: hypothetical protein GTN73_03575 [Candidatus Aminicenantes bacterium]|nr:hypothetical protein [Candidatus Aminicenantes bacterium]
MGKEISAFQKTQVSKQKKIISFFLVATFLIVWNFTRCSPYNRLKRDIKTVSQFNLLDTRSPFLKVHMLDGRVYILSAWKVDDKDKTVSGMGSLLDINRNLIQKSNFTISLDGVAIFETNVVKSSPYIGTMAIITLPSLALSAYCATNPKACFGSCPTFYAWDGEKMALQAEGFSASVTPSLENRDIDALYRVKPLSHDFEIRVTNEALETHVIRYANILALPRPSNGRTFATSSGKFWQAPEIVEPTACTAPEGDCLAAIRFFDGIERFSKTDSKDLATRETIELVFDSPPGGKVGLVLGFRQTLLTTYLFYQGLAYMGRASGYWLAKMERGDKNVKKYSSRLGEVLGGIEIFAQENNDNWVLAGEIRETGPIASDARVVPLPELNSFSGKIRLRLTCGLWRIDYIALAKLSTPAEPLRLLPSSVLRGDTAVDKAKKSLSELSDVLVTMPGDAYTLIYDLPSDYQNYELFLESQGYYIEWIRPSWLTEENHNKTLMMFTNPAGFLKEIAPEFKKVESQMEEIFWRSKYVQK